MEKIIWKKTGSKAPVQYDSKNRFMIWNGKYQRWGLYKMVFKDGTPSECKLLFESKYMKDVKSFADKYINQ